MPLAKKFTGVGLWSAALRWGDRNEALEAAAELEELGFTALWIPDTGGDVFGALDQLLGATRSVPLATGVLNLWMHSAAETGAGCAELAATHGERFLLGIGVSHAPVVDRSAPGRYSKPMASMRTYLDELDAAPQPVPASDRVLAALGPQMLALARDRAAGAHPYNVNPEHIAQARVTLGPSSALLPELAVALEKDPAEARALGRQYLSGYMAFPNYVNNWRRLGFDEGDFADGGSNRLVDSVIAWGDEDAIASRVRAYFDAGADHVAIQVICGRESFPRSIWRTIAPVLTGQSGPTA